MSELVSVVVSVYNIEKYVEKCLESVRKQSYRDVEIIVVDDGSTDESGKICDAVAVQDARVKVYHRKNKGLSAARNFGIAQAKGGLIALVDGDDYVDTEFIATMVTAMKNDVDVVEVGYNEVRPRTALLTGREAAIKLLVQQENVDVVAWNKLYRKKLFNKIQYPDGMKYEDALTTYKLLAAARNVKYLNVAPYHYVVRGDSIMGKARTMERLAARMQAAEEAVEYFRDDSEMTQAAEVARLSAEYAFVDYMIKGEVKAGVGEAELRWIQENRMQYKNNKFLTKKLKLYNFLVKMNLYKMFRKITLRA